MYPYILEIAKPNLTLVLKAKSLEELKATAFSLGFRDEYMKKYGEATYFSESLGKLVAISEMNSQHIANAILKMARSSQPEVLKALVKELARRADDAD